MRTVALFLLLVALVPPALAEKRTICTATINSADEKKIFRQRLPAGDFNFVELTDLAKQTSKEFRGEDWFDAACKAGVQCDVLLISGHFGGSFFGETGFSLGMDRLESHACQSSCDGLLKRPKEVFLFGCNTMAGREADNRTPEQYLQVLLGDNIDRAEAERIVEARYGSAGDSFRNQMRRIFSGVPHIYGFDSIGPSGKTVKPFLKDYFQKIPNYGKHLDVIEAGEVAKTVNDLNRTLRAFTWNENLASALHATSFYECPGLFPGEEPGSNLREDICLLHNPGVAAEKKVEAVGRMLRGDDRLLYLPSLAAYARQYRLSGRTDPAIAEHFAELGKDDALKKILADLEPKLRHSLALKTDLFQLEMLLGWLTQDGFKDKIWESLQPAFKLLDRASVDSICSLVWENQFKYFVKLEDFDPARLRGPTGASVLACLKTRDERISAEIAKAMRTAKGDDRLRLLAAAWELPGSGEEILQVARKQATDPNRELSISARALILHRSSSVEERTKLILSGVPLGREYLSIFAFSADFRDENLARELGKQLLKPGFNSTDAAILIKFMPAKSAYWRELLESVDKLGSSERKAFLSLIGSVKPGDPALADWAIEVMGDPKPEYYYSGLVALISMSDLTPTQLRRIAEVAPKGTESNGAILRGILRRHQDLVPPEVGYVDGPFIEMTCTWDSEQQVSNCTYK